MPHELQREIENHLASFPERYKDVEQMQNEWNEFKSKSFWTLVGFITAIIGVAIWVGTISTRIENIDKSHLKSETINEQIEKRINFLEINNGEIKTRLTSIDATLQEIKIAIRQIQ